MNPRPPSPIRALPSRSLLALLVAVMLCGPLVGCGRYAGLAYFFGAGRKVKIEPKYELPEGTLLIIVDDPAERVTWPRARDLLERYLGEELLAHEAVEQVVSPTAVARFRQSDPRFERYAATKLGRKLGADTVMWIEVREFFAPTEVQDTSQAASMSVSVKVLTTQEEKRADRVRLWPRDAGGEIVEAELNAIDAHKMGGNQAVARELARRGSILIGRLFYQHSVGDIDDEGI